MGTREKAVRRGRVPLRETGASAPASAGKRTGSRTGTQADAGVIKGGGKIRVQEGSMLSL